MTSKMSTINIPTALKSIVFKDLPRHDTCWSLIGGLDGKLYGISYPRNHFFIYDLEKRSLRDLGGFQYVPCDTQGTASIRGLKFLNSRWNIEISYPGQFVEYFAVDGVPVHGTLRVPSDLLEDGKLHSLRILRSEIPFTEPTLLGATGAFVTEVHSQVNSLSFKVCNRVHTSIKLWVPSKPAFKIGERHIDCEWNEQTGIYWCDVTVAAGDTVLCSL